MCGAPVWGLGVVLERMRPTPARTAVSIIVPLYNERQNVAPLHAAIVDAVAPLGIAFEVILVDDGSTDGTFAAAVEVARGDSRVWLIRFRRNCGQTPALAAGIERASGEILITMDGDLQNDPQDIERFLEKIHEGYDVVVGWRRDRKDKLSRTLPSRVANWLIARVTGLPIRDNGCSLKAFRAAVIKRLPLYSDMHRFIPAIASTAGSRIVEIAVRHHPRTFGESKYGMSRIYKVLLDLTAIKTVAAFSTRPLLWFGLASTILALAGSATLVVSITASMFGHATISLPVAGSGVLFLVSSIILAGNGALAELVCRLGDLREHELSRLTERVWGLPPLTSTDE
jgi:glycosyltransferase involved in cell wall biosynthesis